MQDDATIEARVFGHVQGVGFRYFAMDEAQSRGLKGWARNLADGTVEIVAQGPREALDQFIEALRQAPFPAQVTHIEVRSSPPAADLKDFDIRR
jgi:acylphosphatase